MQLQPKQLQSKPLQKPPKNFAMQPDRIFGDLNDYADRADLLNESLSNAPQIVHEMIAQLSDPNFDKSQLKYIALVGPTGCGKSILARAIAHALKRDYLFLASTDLLSSYRRGTEKNIRALFRQLGEYRPFPLLILDEMSMIGGGNKPTHKDQIEALEVVCSLLDRQSSNNDFLMIGTTCDPEDIAVDLKYRCKVTPIPQIAVTQRIFLIAISKHPRYSLSENCNQEYLEQLARRAKIFSIRCINGMVEAAVTNAWGEKSKVITTAHLDSACDKMLYNRRKFTSLPME